MAESGSLFHVAGAWGVRRGDGAAVPGACPAPIRCSATTLPEAFSTLLASGKFKPEDVAAEFCDVVTGKKAGRRNADEIILYKSPGMGILDSGIGHWIYGRAVKKRTLAWKCPSAKKIERRRPIFFLQKFLEQMADNKVMAMTRTLLALVFVGWLSLFSTVTAGEADFFKGQTVRLVVGMSPGGGFQFAPPVLARHLSKHIPGKPAILVENMPGAGSLLAANYIARLARPDGLTVGMVSGAPVMGQLQGNKAVTFDVQDGDRRFARRMEPVCVVNRKSGIEDAAAWKASSRPVEIGVTSPGAGAHEVPLVVNAALGLPIHPVSGYPGTADIRLAVESGEVDGACFSSGTPLRRCGRRR